MSLTEETDTARHYRRRALKIRSVAAESHLEIRQALLRIADNYELMAESLKRIDQTNKVLDWRAEWARAAGTTSIGDRVMGAMRKNAKKKAKQRAHAEKRRAQEEAIVAASESHIANRPQRPSGARGI